MATWSDLDKSLQDLEQSDWGEPTYDSYLVKTIHRLRRVPLRKLTIEDLRIMIGQNIGLPYLMPLALDELRKCPLAEGDYYHGDLLNMVLPAEPKFWQEHPDWRAEVREAGVRALNQLHQTPLDDDVLKGLTEAWLIFESGSRGLAP
jgi:hypothetical protein